MTTVAHIPRPFYELINAAITEGKVAFLSGNAEDTFLPQISPMISSIDQFQPMNCHQEPHPHRRKGLLHETKRFELTK